MVLLAHVPANGWPAHEPKQSLGLGQHLNANACQFSNQFRYAAIFFVTMLSTVNVAYRVPGE
jgi:hypothetical protein